MTIKFNSAAANQYLSVPDSAGLTYPSGDFCLSWVMSFDTPSGANPEYLISNGAYQSAGSFNVTYNGTSNAQVMSVYGPTQAEDLSGTRTVTSGVWLYVLQRSGTNLTLRYSPILSTLPTTGSSVTLEVTKTYSTAAYDGSGGLVIGGRTDLTATRFANQSIGRVFRFDGVLTDLEVAKLAYGMEITDLGKTPAWYFRMDTVSDISDRGSLGLVATPHGAITTGTAPAFGYTAAGPPVISGVPTIVGSPQVGSASSYTPASVSANPASTRTQQWKIDGVAISGATGTTYTPVAGDATKTLTVTQTETNGNGSANATSAGSVVGAAGATIDFTQIEAERIFQRAGTTAAVAMSGTYTGTVPTSIEYQLYAADGTTILVPWTVISGATISGGNWSGAPLVAQGGMYRLCTRSKSGSTILATSNIKANLFGVGDIYAWTGSSSASRQFDSYSGTGYTPAANVRRHMGGAWSAFGVDGCAITTANALAARFGVPIGMMGYGAGGVTLADWNDLSNSLWVNFSAAIGLVGGKITGLFVSVGSNDAANGLVTSRAQHLGKLRQHFTNVRTLTGQSSLPICLSGFNRRPGVAADAADFVRMAENDVGDDANISHIQTVDFPIDTDNIHLTPAAFNACAVRTVNVFGQRVAGGAYLRGPKMTGVSYTASAIKATLAHRNGSDFTPTSGITGFAATDDSGALGLSNVARNSATEITITPSRAIAGRPTLTYLSGSSPNVSASVFDNGSMPLPMTVETTMIAAADASVVTGVSLSPTSSTLGGNSTQQFSATVQGTNSPSQAVTWSKISGVGSLSASGLYSSPASTTSAQSAVIAATSVQNNNYSAQATVTIPAVAAGSTVTAVTVTPASVTVVGSGTVDFDWVVQGTNSPSQAATVSTTLGTINSAGILIAPAATSATQVGTVTVTSIQDSTKSGTATFTVLGVAPLPDPTPAPVLALYSPLVGTFNVMGSLL